MRLITYYGIYEVSEEQAEKLNNSDATMVKIDGDYIQRREIKAIIREDKFHDYLYQHHKWECARGKVHHQDDECQCEYDQYNQKQHES